MNNKCLDYIFLAGPGPLIDEIYVSDSRIESPPKVNNESLRFKTFSHEVKLSHLSQTSLS